MAASAVEALCRLGMKDSAGLVADMLVEVTAIVGGSGKAQKARDKIRSVTAYPFLIFFSPGFSFAVFVEHDLVFVPDDTLNEGVGSHSGDMGDRFPLNEL